MLHELKIMVLLLKVIKCYSYKHLNVLLPNSSPYWKTNKETGQKEGFLVDIAKELFLPIKLNYSLINNPKLKTYESLGNIQT